MKQIGAPALSIKHLSLGQPPNLWPKLQVGIKVWIHVEGEGIPFTWMKGALEFWRMSDVQTMGIEKSWSWGWPFSL